LALPRGVLPRSTWRRAYAHAVLVLTALSCTLPAERAPGQSDTVASARGPVSTDARAWVLLTDGGDTIAHEIAREGDGWLEVALRLDRRAESQRIVLASRADAAARWDVLRTWQPAGARPDERSRLLPFGDSLAVVQGALIGVPVNVRTLPVPPGVAPWHDASAALLERVVRDGLARAGDADRPVVSLTVPDRVRRVRVTRIGTDSVRVAHPDGDWLLHLDASGRVLGGVSPARRLVLHHVAAPAYEPAPGRADTVRSASGVVHEHMVLHAPDGVRLAGTFTRPASALRAPVVLFVSGSGPQDRDLGVPGFDGYAPFAELAASLAARGIASLRVDDRGTGASGGSAFSATFADAARDVRAQLAWLRGRADVRPTDIAVVGHSDGGHIALDVAASDTALRAVLLLGTPAQSGRALARAQRRLWVASSATSESDAEREGERDAEREAERLAERVAARDPWLRDWLSHDPARVLGRVSAPVLVAHGAHDGQVPEAQADSLAALLRARGARAVVVQRLSGVNHLLLADTSGDPRGYRSLPSRALPAAVRDTLVGWLSEHLVIRVVERTRKHTAERLATRP
jgi:alpha-beta hydrolase superfamily lysophospholipase